MTRVYSIARVACLMAMLTAAGVAGCAAPAYDETTDKSISTLQNDIDSELISLASLGERIERLRNRDDAASKKALADALSKASFDANSASYDKIDLDLTTVRLRIDAEPNASTENLDAALGSLRDNLFGEKSLRDTHSQEDVLHSAYVETEKQTLDQQLQALLAYEIVLKKGASSSKSAADGSQ